jgi:uncharacterized protein
MPSHELYNRLKDEIDSVPVVDSHEHLYLPEEDYLKMGCDFAHLLMQYNIDDLVSAGMPITNFKEFQESMGFVLRNGGAPMSLEEKWRHIAPYWEMVRDTGYGRGARHTMAKFCGADDLSDATYKGISERLAAQMKPGAYRRFLKDACGFTAILDDVDSQVKPGMFERLDRSLFRFVARFRQFTYAYLPGVLEEIERMSGRTVRTLDRLVDILDEQFDKWTAEGRVALKIGDAYRRDIRYEESSHEEADSVFRRIFTLRRFVNFQDTFSLREGRPFENYMTHRVLERAEERDIPVIIHTGIQAFTNNDPECSRVGLLTPLFIKYPKLRFHILHSSYPWMGEAASLAKMYPNVTLDLTWTQIIVPEGAREGLGHMLDMVPSNKIHTFGGDHLVPESVWGALEVARENVTHVLADRVERGNLTEARAVQLAHRLFHENAERIFRLG